MCSTMLAARLAAASEYANYILNIGVRAKVRIAVCLVKFTPHHRTNGAKAQKSGHQRHYAAASHDNSQGLGR